MLRGTTSHTVSYPSNVIQFTLLIKAYVSVASEVCKDLVIYDVPKHNPFYDLIPLTKQHEVLLHIIIANSALHMSNASQKLLISDMTAFPVQYRPNTLDSTSSSSSIIQRPKSYRDALAAKQRALHLLNSALNDMPSADIDVTLAVVLLFIEFELIDSGKDNWRRHVNGARTIIDILLGSNKLAHTAMSSLRSCLISNCLVYVGLLDPKNVLTTH
jgi:Fungal specific transcription factor domain